MSMNLFQPPMKYPDGRRLISPHFWSCSHFGAIANDAFRWAPLSSNKTAVATVDLECRATDDRRSTINYTDIGHVERGVEYGGRTEGVQQTT